MKADHKAALEWAKTGTHSENMESCPDCNLAAVFEQTRERCVRILQRELDGLEFGNVYLTRALNAIRALQPEGDKP